MGGTSFLMYIRTYKGYTTSKRGSAMCTCMVLRKNGFFVGRNMDIEKGFGEEILEISRKFPLHFSFGECNEHHYAILGMGTVSKGYPLLADAMNEKGLCMAGLHFPGNAYYEENARDDRINLAPFELMPYVLGTCSTLREAKEKLLQCRLVAIPFSDDLPLTPLHWFLADRTGSAVLEATKDGLFVYDDPVDVLTNNPPFPFHLANLQQYANLTNGRQTAQTPMEEFCREPFGLGLGGVGLPGDYSSPSRFVKAAYLLRTSVCPDGDHQKISIVQMFHLLAAVAPPCGSVLTPKGECHMTTYSCCMAPDEEAYYYVTYGNLCPVKICFHSNFMNESEMLHFPLKNMSEIKAEE